MDNKKKYLREVTNLERNAIKLASLCKIFTLFFIGEDRFELTHSSCLIFKNVRTFTHLL